ncbi:MAG TPA: phospholipase D-like domain-containing protein [Ktedonobacteraceae bacterium]|nr:phospholipase D-like domain-containing protein [Ktedonobacteraceae bacterium]
MPQTVAHVAHTLSTTVTAVRELQTELEEANRKRGTTQNRDERNALEQRVRELEQAVEHKQQESNQLRLQLEQRQGAFLRTEEHRTALEQAIASAKEEIIIIAPWLNRRTCDEALCSLIAQAVKRGVHIRIGYGITERLGDPDAARHRANAQRVISLMKNAVEREKPHAPTGRLEIQRVSDTHQKILICDRAYGVVGSFNWLSYRGELDNEYRNETSVVLREPTAVAELAKIALRGWAQ